jgi:hypothetical protein
MKPDWKYAPDWAQWLAMDHSGDWYWYEHAPIRDKYGWVWFSGRYEMCRAKPTTKWKLSLEPRP